MKKVSNSAVEMAMSFLIITNGKTTTLEVKNMLRANGYFAEQNEVSAVMTELVDTHNMYGPLQVLTRTQNENGNYYDYSFSEFGFANAPQATDVNVAVIGGDGDEESKEIDIDVDDSDEVINSNMLVSKSVCLNHQNGDDWFGSEKHSNVGVIFDEDLTSDNVRCAMAKLLRKPIQDMRAKRVRRVK